MICHLPQPVQQHNELDIKRATVRHAALTSALDVPAKSAKAATAGTEQELSQLVQLVRQSVANLARLFGELAGSRRRNRSRSCNRTRNSLSHIANYDCIGAKSRIRRVRQKTLDLLSSDEQIKKLRFNTHSSSFIFFPLPSLPPHSLLLLLQSTPAASSTPIRSVRAFVPTATLTLTCLAPSRRDARLKQREATLFVVCKL